ncbi:uncharacterized protein LOC125676812 [Ostrea edulis]|uniref:uncharacterized protein LOC125676812 n=1 Tax=Ostrea edulis TaxID=37623 RepID=UPI0024AFF6B1|nr:uncharacterized protein LOC125676812 [Ostrea edulis]
MAAPVGTHGSTRTTPRKVYPLGNICLICGFSFVSKSVDTDGNIKINKYLDKKLRLSTDRMKVLKDVCGISDSVVYPTDTGVCQKCFRSTERVLKLEKEAATMRESFKASVQLTLQRFNVCVPFPSKRFIEKREIRSPFKENTDVKRVRPDDPLLVPIRRVMPVKLVQLQPASANVIVNKARRSLGGDFLKQVYVHYPSGKKTALITSELHKSICKTIVGRSNVEQTIVNHLCSSNPEVVTNGVSRVVMKEAQTLCKRGSGSILQSKNFKDFFQFKWEQMKEELRRRCPTILTLLSAVVSDKELSSESKGFIHIMVSAAIALHGRNQEMSFSQYMTALVLTHGGCIQRDIERLSNIGLSVHPKTIHRKLESWKELIDVKVKELRDSWADSGNVKYQLVGDNWDKNILPSYRTSDRGTLSLHLFNVIAVQDRVPPLPELPKEEREMTQACEFLPSIADQKQLMKELTFLFATSIIEHNAQLHRVFNTIYPKHLDHPYSHYSGLKTFQYPLGLYDCNENKTQELIALLKKLSNDFIPQKNGEIVEPVFFGGDRLTDERVQSAQNAMKNAATPKEKLEGFISKIEDFHRLMNFLEAIAKMTFSTDSGQDAGTLYYYRNLLNHRGVKGEVKNSYRPYKLLCYTVFDAICQLFLLHHFDMTDVDSNLPFPEEFQELSDNAKVEWLNLVCSEILQTWFFENENDICKELRDVLDDPQHSENYWLSRMLENERLKCHFCEATYACVGSLQSHEQKKHDVQIPPKQSKLKEKKRDQLQDYLVMVFKLVILHKNLDTAVDMGDGERAVRSAKYELPLYNKTNKVKYLIGSVQLTALTSNSGVLTEDQRQRLVANRFVNIQGGQNNNIALDEYLEMVNRDSKVACTGNQTKDSIILHSKEYPHLVNFVKHLDEIANVRQKKGFHHLPSYQSDVKKVLQDLMQNDILVYDPNRKLHCKKFVIDRNPFDNAFTKLPIMIHRHKPTLPFCRLRNLHI